MKFVINLEEIIDPIIIKEPDYEKETIIFYSITAIDFYTRQKMRDLNVFQFKNIDNEFPREMEDFPKIRDYIYSDIPDKIDPIITSLRNKLQESNELPILAQLIETSIDVQSNTALWSYRFTNSIEFAAVVDPILDQSLDDMVDSFIKRMSASSSVIMITFHFKYKTWNFLKYYCKVDPRFKERCFEIFLSLMEKKDETKN